MYRNQEITKSVIFRIFHPRLIWKLFWPIFDIKFRHVEKFRPQNAKILKVMPKNVIFWISNFTIWYILKNTPTYAGKYRSQKARILACLTKWNIRNFFRHLKLSQLKLSQIVSIMDHELFTIWQNNTNFLQKCSKRELYTQKKLQISYRFLP